MWNYQQSNRQVFYLFDSIDLKMQTIFGTDFQISSNDLLGAFKENICIGSQPIHMNNSTSQFTVLPCMGSSINSQGDAINGLENDEIPSILYYHFSSKKIYTLYNPKEEDNKLEFGSIPGFKNNEYFIIIDSDIRNMSEGCTNRKAINYDQNAVVDNGFCLYNQDYLDVSNLDSENTRPRKTINIPGGWSIIGYPCESSINVEEAFDGIKDNIEIVKDSLGKSYIPSWNFNGIGDLQYGQGYQIKLKKEIVHFLF